MDRQTAQLLAQAGHAAPSADNSQPERFAWDGQRLQIHYDTPRVVGKTFAPGSPATLLSVGAALENMQRIDQHFKLGMTVTVAAPDAPIGSPYATIHAAHAAPSEASTADLPLFNRHTNRFPYAKAKSIPDEVKQGLQQLDERSARLQLAEAREAVASIAQLARQAAEVRFQTQEIHELLAGSLRYTEAQVDTGDGMDVRTLHLPPGGAAFLRFTSDWQRMRMLNKVGAYKFMASVDSKLLAQSPLILAVSGEESNEGAINAGRLLCRAWSQLNAQGIAVHPYYVVADQIARLREGTVPDELVPLADDCLEQTNRLLELGSDETLYMLLRVGYPTREAPRSRRLPLQQIFTDLTG